MENCNFLNHLQIVIQIESFPTETNTEKNKDKKSFSLKSPKHPNSVDLQGHNHGPNRKREKSGRRREENRRRSPGRGKPRTGRL